MSKATPVIGRNELVDIVDHAIAGIPAKIDTGADSCAIWASNIREHKGKLIFTLFGPGSTYYSGQSVSTDHYKVTSVKNSFGNREARYTVWLPVRLHNRRYKVRFNLADRSQNHFPILLGKRFLNRKFLVDVSKSYLLQSNEPSGSQKILVLASKKTNKSSGFFDEVSKYVNAEVTHCQYSDLVFEMGVKPRITIAKSGEDLDSFRLVFFKSHRAFAEHALAVAAYLHYKNVVFRDEEVESPVSHSKLSEMMILSCHNLAVPETVVAASDYLVSHAEELGERLGWPFVLKEVFSDRGQNNFLVNNPKELAKCIANAPENSVFATQKLIPNKGFYRLLVMGREVVMAIKRKPFTHDDPLKAHLNKPRDSRINSSLVKPRKMDASVTSLALNAADVMRRQIAGVDVLQDKATGKWYILEVNASPQLYGPTYSAIKAQHLAHYLNTELERW